MDHRMCAAGADLTATLAGAGRDGARRIERLIEDAATGGAACIDELLRPAPAGACGGGLHVFALLWAAARLRTDAGIIVMHARALRHTVEELARLHPEPHTPAKRNRAARPAGAATARARADALIEALEGVRQATRVLEAAAFPRVPEEDAPRPAGADALRWIARRIGSELHAAAEATEAVQAEIGRLAAAAGAPAPMAAEPA